MPVSNQADIDAADEMMRAKRERAAAAATAKPAAVQPTTQPEAKTAEKPAASQPAAFPQVDEYGNILPPLDADGSINWRDLGMGMAKGVHTATSNMGAASLTDWLVTHLGGEQSGEKFRAANARVEAAKEQLTSPEANVGNVLGQAAVIAPSMMGIGGLTRGAILAGAGIRAGSRFAGSALQSIADLAGGSAQGALSAQATGGNPLAGAIAGGGLSVLGQGAGALGQTLANSTVAKLLHSKLMDMAAGVQYGLIGPILKGITAKYGSSIANGVADLISEGNRLGLVSAPAGSAAGYTVNHLLTPPKPSTTVAPSVSGLLPQTPTGTTISPAVPGLLPNY